MLHQWKCANNLRQNIISMLSWNQKANTLNIFELEVIMTKAHSRENLYFRTHVTNSLANMIMELLLICSAANILANVSNLSWPTSLFATPDFQQQRKLLRRPMRWKWELLSYNKKRGFLKMKAPPFVSRFPLQCILTWCHRSLGSVNGLRMKLCDDIMIVKHLLVEKVSLTCLRQSSL